MELNSTWVDKIDEMLKEIKESERAKPPLQEPNEKGNSN